MKPPRRVNIAALWCLFSVGSVGGVIAGLTTERLPCVYNKKKTAMSEWNTFRVHSLTVWKVVAVTLGQDIASVVLQLFVDKYLPEAEKKLVKAFREKPYHPKVYYYYK